MDATSFIAKQIVIRQRRLRLATTEYAMECHEKAIAKLVSQRLCQHSFITRARVQGKNAVECTRCKLRFLD